MSGSIVERIVEHIAEREGVEPEDLETPLENHVPTDAIRALVNHESTAWTLEFETTNHVVTVTGTGEIGVDEEKIPTSL